MTNLVNTIEEEELDTETNETPDVAEEATDDMLDYDTGGASDLDAPDWDNDDWNPLPEYGITNKLDYINEEIENFNALAPRFAGIIAVILLLLWSATAILMLSKPYIGQINITDGMTWVHTTVGGLVSALIVTVLASSKPGANPATRFPLFRTIKYQMKEVEQNIKATNDKNKKVLTNINSLKQLYNAQEKGETFDRYIVYYFETKDNLQSKRKKVVKPYEQLLILYLSIWVTVGFFALSMAVILDGSDYFVDTIKSTGTNWLGVAVASTYAYFGIDPEDEDQNGNQWGGYYG